MTRIILLASILAGCSLTVPPIGQVERIPGTRSTQVTMPGGVRVDPIETSRAMHEFAIVLDDDAAREIVDTMTIYYVNDDDLDRLIRQHYFGVSGCACVGVELNRWEVAVIGHVDVTRTALVHELMHVYLHRTTGDPDASHAIPPGPWTYEHEAVIEEVEAYLRDRLCL